MKKLTDEQLSRVLSAHDNGFLMDCGDLRCTYSSGCLMQVANCDDRSYEYAESYDVRPRSNASWFDKCWVHNWSPDEFLSAMEKAGIA